MQQLRLVNNRVVYMYSIMLMTLQELCESCRASCYYTIFCFGVKWQNFLCAWQNKYDMKILAQFLQMGERVYR